MPTQNDGASENTQHVHRLCNCTSVSVVTDHIPCFGNRVSVVSLVINVFAASCGLVGSRNEHVATVQLAILEWNGGNYFC